MFEIPDLELPGEQLQMMPDIESEHGIGEADDFREQMRPSVIEDRESEISIFGNQDGHRLGIFCPNMSRSSI